MSIENEPNVTKLLHSAADGYDGTRHATQVGDPEFTDLVDRIFDKGVVFDAADRISLLSEDLILGARKDVA